MHYILVTGLVIVVVAIVVGLRLGWELLQQNGRMLLRMEALEKRLEGKAESREQKANPGPQDHGLRDDETAAEKAEERKAESDESHGTPVAASAGGDRTARFGNRLLANSKIKRDGLKAGTMAPDFRLPRLDGGELALSDLRGKLVLLVFSSPHCGPCNALAPKLEKFHRKHPQLAMVMISREDAEANRVKVDEHGLTFPVVLQKQWEVSRPYAFFGTPVAYLVDSLGVITADAAIGVDAILDLMKRAKRMLRCSGRREDALVNSALRTPRSPLARRLAGWNVRVAFASLQKLSAWLGLAMGKLQLFELKHFKLVPRPDDIFIVTYPRSGTTWMQMILYQLTSDGNMDIPHIAEHCPWFERSVRSQDVEQRTSPRVFKSHLSFDQIPKGPGRYIYVARDGRDVAVSYYNLYRNYNAYKGSFAEFFEQFMRGKVYYGSWFRHVAGWWQHRNERNVLFLTYEELTHDLEACLQRIIAFCHRDAPPAKLPLILERCSFAFMKQHETKFDPALEVLWEQGTQLNSFLRAGRTGEGARELTPEQKVRFDHAFHLLLEPNSFGWPARVPGIEASAPIPHAYAEA